MSSVTIHNSMEKETNRPQYINNKDIEFAEFLMRRKQNLKLSLVYNLLLVVNFLILLFLTFRYLFMDGKFGIIEVIVLVLITINFYLVHRLSIQIKKDDNNLFSDIFSKINKSSITLTNDEINSAWIEVDKNKIDIK